MINKIKRVFNNGRGFDFIFFLCLWRLFGSMLMRQNLFSTLSWGFMLCFFPHLSSNLYLQFSVDTLQEWLLISFSFSPSDSYSTNFMEEGPIFQTFIFLKILKPAMNENKKKCMDQERAANGGAIGSSPLES